ncbi:MAG: hypothetical protein GF372_06975, partial [Candidatus Marinimicrobia bacterium]|nr:hypothetical protein [Candidatus Neomarinimicrobiota bacterium]
MKSRFDKYFRFTLTAILLLSFVFSGTRIIAQESSPDLPVAWSTYRVVDSIRTDIADLKAHGVGVISMDASTVSEADSLLQIARDTGMKYFLSMPDITEHMNLVEEFELKPAPALMIGGVYRGRAIDRHLFTFEPQKQRILIEPPVYNSEYAYTRGSGATGQPLASEPIAHYYPDIGQPIRAEIIVPTETFDGTQHIEIVSATIAKAPPDTNLLFDSVSPGMLPSSEVENRQLYTVSFDLTGYENA